MMHVQSIEGDGSSNAYILITTVVPVPKAVLPGMLGLGVVGVKLRKFAYKNIDNNALVMFQKTIKELFINNKRRKCEKMITKKISLIILFCAALCASSTFTMAGMYEMGTATAVSMRLLYTSAGDFGNLQYVGYNPGGPGDWGFGPYGEYGAGADNMYYAVGFTSELNDNNQSGFASLVNPRLSDIYDGFELPIVSDNDDEWRYQAYVTAEAGTAYSTVTDIGLELQLDRLFNEGASGEDNVEVVPVPSTLLLVILGLGATCVTGVKLRRFA